MKRRNLIATGCASLTVGVSGCLDRIKYRDEPWVSATVIPENIRLGFDVEQVLEISLHQSNVMATKLPDENQEHHINIDVSLLEQYGVDIEDLSVDTTQGNLGSGPPDAYNNNVDSVEFADGVIDLVIVTSENIHETDPIALKLTGYRFTDVEAVTEIQYEVQSQDDHLEISNGVVNRAGSNSKCGFSSTTDGKFTLVAPELLPPTLCPNPITNYSNNQSNQTLTIEWLTPEADEVVIKIDISVLEEYGTIEEAVIEPLNRRGNVDEPMIWGANLEEITINDWTVLMRLVPDPGTNYISAVVNISGINITTTDPARGLSYGMTIEGDVDDMVETESFDIIEEPIDNDA